MTQTKNAEQDVLPSLLPPMVQTSPTSTEQEITKLEMSKAKKIKFGKLPREIIAQLAQYENRAEYIDKHGELQSYPNDSPKWYRGRTVEVLSKDLNHDGIPEKVVVTDDSADYDVSRMAYFFALNNGKWSILQTGIFGSPENLEFISNGKSGEFDIIGYGGERPDEDGKPIKFMGYWRIKNGKYDERFECRETRKGIEKVIPCPE